MNENDLYGKLIAAARKNSPSEAVPYAFEKRIVSHLSARPAPNIWGLWCRPLWQAALSCVAITVLCAVWVYGNRPNTEAADNFSQDFEAAVFAPMSEHIEDALVSPWKVILATMVIFVCGIITGSMLTRTTMMPRMEPPLAVPPSPARPPVQPMLQMQRSAFFKVLDKQLELTGAQRDQIGKIMKASQERTQPLWNQIAPQMNEELKNVREEIRALLTLEQRKKFGELLKRNRKADAVPPGSGRPLRSNESTTSATNSF